MIYQLGQVSNRDTQLLYSYRILRHASTQLTELCRYDNPDVFFLDKCEEVNIDDKVMYEYHLSAKRVLDRIPYLEFMSDDEVELKHMEDLTEVEVKSNELIIRGDTDKLTEKTSVAVYWVPSLQYIDKLQQQIESIIGNLEDRYENDQKLINRINVSSGYVMNVEGLVPNLANIGQDDIGLIYDDSRYRLSGSVAEQLVINPSQSVVSSMLKSHNGDLQIGDNQKESKVYQGFYGGRIKLSGQFKTLVLKDITSVVLLTGISADKIIISNCPAVMFRTDVKTEGSSGTIKRLEVRNSYLTIYQPITISTIWCYQRSTVVHKKGQITRIGFVEAGSTLIYDIPSTDNVIDIIDIHSLQGLFYTVKPPKDKPYLDDIFLSQKPIAFQRGQVEDPVPISESIVHIHLNQGGSVSPEGPSGGGKIYSPFTDWCWSGDSRTTQMHDYTGVKIASSEGGQGYDWFSKHYSEVAGVKGYNIFFWWGVNDVSSYKEFANLYIDIANGLGDDSKVFVGTVGHCPDGTGSGRVDGGGGQDLDSFNKDIEAFNAGLKEALSGVSNIVILDVAEYIKELEKDKGASWLTGDNLHYLSDASKMIYDWVCSQITNVEPGEWLDQPTNGESDIMIIYSALRDSGWTKNAAIGALANMRHESNWITHMIGYNSTYFKSYTDRSEESLLDLMNSATSGADLYNKIQATSTNGDLVGYGLTQFTSDVNLNALYDQHVSTGLAYDRLGTQIPAFKKVLEICSLWDDMNAQTSPGDAAYYLCLYYEVPYDRYNQAKKRREEANNLANAYDFYD